MNEFEITESLRKGFTEVIEKVMEKSGWNASSLSYEAHTALDDAFMDLYDKEFK